MSTYSKLPHLAWLAALVAASGALILSSDLIEAPGGKDSPLLRETVVMLEPPLVVSSLDETEHRPDRRSSYGEKPRARAEELPEIEYEVLQGDLMSLLTENQAIPVVASTIRVQSDRFAYAGLLAGDGIQSINGIDLPLAKGMPVGSILGGSTMELTIKRGDGVHTLTITRYLDR